MSVVSLGYNIIALIMIKALSGELEPARGKAGAVRGKRNGAESGGARRVRSSAAAGSGTGGVRLELPKF